MEKQQNKFKDKTIANFDFIMVVVLLIPLIILFSFTKGQKIPVLLVPYQAIAPDINIHIIVSIIILILFAILMIIFRVMQKG